MKIENSIKEAFQKAGKSIVLIGFMGVGKTAVGMALADMIGAELVDSDAEIEKLTKKTIAQIFEDDGEEVFRQMERDFILEALSGDELVILSTGGGAFLDEDTRKIILEKATSVWLQATEDTIFKRTEADLNERGHERPKIHFIDGTRTLTTLDQRKEIIGVLLEERSSIYATCAYSVDTEKGNPEENARTVIEYAIQYG